MFTRQPHADRTRGRRGRTSGWRTVCAASSPASSRSSVGSRRRSPSPVRPRRRRKRRGRRRLRLGRVRRLDARSDPARAGAPGRVDPRRRHAVLRRRGRRRRLGRQRRRRHGAALQSRRRSRKGRCERLSVGSRPTAIAYGAGAVWVANRGDDSVTRIDPGTGSHDQHPGRRRAGRPRRGRRRRLGGELGRRHRVSHRPRRRTRSCATIDVGSAPSGDRRRSRRVSSGSRCRRRERLPLLAEADARRDRTSARDATDPLRHERRVVETVDRHHRRRVAGEPHIELPVRAVARRTLSRARASEQAVVLRPSRSAPSSSPR